MKLWEAMKAVEEGKTVRVMIIYANVYATLNEVGQFNGFLGYRDGWELVEEYPLTFLEAMTVLQSRGCGTMEKEDCVTTLTLNMNGEWGSRSNPEYLYQYVNAKWRIVE